MEGEKSLLKTLNHLSSCCKPACYHWTAYIISPSALKEQNGALAEGKCAVIQAIVTREKLFTIWPRVDQLPLPCRSFWPQPEPETVWFLFYGRKCILSRLLKGDRGRMKRAPKWSLVNLLLQIWSIFSISRWIQRFSKRSIFWLTFSFLIYLGISTYMS